MALDLQKVLPQQCSCSITHGAPCFQVR